MSAAHAYIPEEAQPESVDIELQETLPPTTDKSMAPIPEIVLSVDSSFVTIDLDDGESYTVPRRIKRRRRDLSMCSDLSNVSEIITEAANELARQGLSYTRLDGSSSGRDTLSVPGSHTASLATSPRSRPISLTQATAPQVQYTSLSCLSRNFSGHPILDCKDFIDLLSGGDCHKNCK